MALLLALIALASFTAGLKHSSLLRAASSQSSPFRLRVEASEGSTDPINLITSKISPTDGDMRVFAKILANLTDHIDSQPDIALSMYSFMRTLPLRSKTL